MAPGASLSTTVQTIINIIKMMKRFIAAILLAGACTMAFGQIERPKLVVGFVVDQMRWDYLYYYYDQYGEGGFKRLLREGFSCENTMINYVPTVTAIGHSSIYTGSVPALTGIAGNDFMVNGKSMYCVADSTVKSVGSNSKAGLMSPRNLLATGIGDMLKVATDYKAKVFGVALKDRASILPAGHAANAAYWWDTSAGHFITSTYYMNQLPEWVKKFNKTIQVKPGTDVKGVPDGVTKTFQMAKAVLDNEHLGEGPVTDMLAISISSTDIIGHAYGTRGKENHDVYMRTDEELAKFLTYLDSKVGKGNYLFFLSADHGGMHNANVMKQHKIPADGYAAWNEIKPLNAAFKEKYGIEKVALMANANRIYLNHAAIAKAGLQLDNVKREVADYLSRNPKVHMVVDYANAVNANLPQLIRERIVNGWNPDRSGDLFVVPKPHNVDGVVTPDYRGTSHGVWNPYDSHIPMVFMGWKVKHGQTSTPTRIVDIAPTVCEMLHIQMPNTCIGDAVNEIVNPK